MVDSTFMLSLSLKIGGSWKNELSNWYSSRLQRGLCFLLKILQLLENDTHDPQYYRLRNQVLTFFLSLIPCILRVEVVLMLCCIDQSQKETLIRLTYVLNAAIPPLPAKENSSCGNHRNG